MLHEGALARGDEREGHREEGTQSQAIVEVEKHD